MHFNMHLRELVSILCNNNGPDLEIENTIVQYVMSASFNDIYSVQITFKLML